MSKADSTRGVRVVCRFRPPNDREAAEGGKVVVRFTGPTTLVHEVRAWLKLMQSRGRTS